MHARFPALLAIAALFCGCAPIDHIRNFRDARQDFSATAQTDNASSLKDLFPNPATLPPASATYDFTQAAESHQRWHDVHLTLAALNSRAADRLRADQLYGSSRALEILAKSRVDMY